MRNAAKITGQGKPVKQLRTQLGVKPGRVAPVVKPVRMAAPAGKLVAPLKVK